MSYLIILGIIVIGIGTLVIYLGTQKDSDKSQQILVDKINTFNDKLVKIQTDQTDKSDKQLKISNLTNEFDTWAADIQENYPEIQLSFKKTQLELSEKELMFNKKWRPFFVKVLVNVEKMIDAINNNLKEPEKIFLHKNNSFPESIFQNDESKFSLILKFNGSNFWKISLYRPPFKQEKIRLPSIDIAYATSDDKLKNDFLSKDEFTVEFYNTEKIHCEQKGVFKFIDVNKFPTEVTIENVNEILKTCIQYQLMQIKTTQIK